MSPITTHVLDTAKGVPASGIEVTLAKKQGNDLTTVAKGITDEDGRIMQWQTDHFKKLFTDGHYLITFATSAYHKGQGFFPEVSIDFQVNNPEQHYHVPLLLSPFSYSTYRGS